MTIKLAFFLALTLALGACGSKDPAASNPDAAAPSPDGATPIGTEADAAPTTLALPFAVDDWYGPSGYMGDGAQPGAISDAMRCADPRPGQGRGLCHAFTYIKGSEGWGGVFWQYPDGSWGEQPGLDIPAGATEVSFYAWGDAGGEVVTFLVGMTGPDRFEVKLADVALAATPTRYSLDLAGTGYDLVTGGFAWSAAGADEPITIYLDDLVWQ